MADQFYVQVPGKPRFHYLCDPAAKPLHGKHVSIRFKEDGQVDTRAMLAIVLTKKPSPFHRLRVQFIDDVSGEPGARLWIGSCDEDWEVAPVVGRYEIVDF